MADRESQATGMGAEDAARLNWHWAFLQRLRALLVAEGRQWSLLEGREEDFPEHEPCLIVEGRALPAAAAAIFLPGRGLRMLLGEAAYREAWGPIAFTGPLSEAVVGEFGSCWDPPRGAEDVRIVGIEPAGEWAGLPYLSFMTLWGQLVVSAHPEIPRRPDGLPDLRVLELPRDAWHTLAPASETPARPGRRPRPPRAPRIEILRFPCDRILKGAIEGLSHVCRWQPGEGFHRAYAPSVTRRGDFAMQIGFRADPGEAIWRFLVGRGEGTIKAHYALWTRLYEQTGGAPGQWATMDLNQFCADLGYTRHHKGGFRREHRQEAMRLLEALTTVEIAVSFMPPGKGAALRRLRGTLWTRGLVGEQRDRYGDLFGQAREGDAALWDPLGFTFGPGPWFSDPVWRARNRSMGLIGAGLLRLRTDQDQTAIRIGGYLGTLARSNQYRPVRLRVPLLLERIGLAERYPKDPQKLQEAVSTALMKLQEVAVIAGWEYTDADPTEPDMDDPVALASLVDTTFRPWRQRVIEIHWPAALTRVTRRLEESQRQAVAARKPRRSQSD